MVSEKLGILVGGGPAPGINGVISAATIEAKNNGLGVIGFFEGFRHLMEGNSSHTTELEIADVSRIHFLGGSILLTSRTNPTKKTEYLDNILKVFRHFGVRYLLTIGGDDTAYSASKVAQRGLDAVAVAHVPKTIDNDLPLPPSIPTFGFQTARHLGVQIVQNLMADSQTAAPRWYIVVAMGRHAGHLSLGIGKAAAAPLTLIPEEFGNRTVVFGEVCDIVEGAIHKRLLHGSSHGVAILAEGLLEHMEMEQVVEIFGEEAVDLDAHGHIKLDNLELGRKVRDEIQRRLKKRGLEIQIVNKNLGYELRCANPIPYDCEYTRDLGYGAVRFLLAGGSGAVITFHGGTMKPLPFEELRDEKTGRPKVRMVDVTGESYEVARKYMIRLDKQDRNLIGRLAEVANVSPEEYEETFGYLMK